MLIRRFPHRTIIKYLTTSSIVILSVAFLLLALGFASARQDSDGNAISNDLICIGGAVLSDTEENGIECAVGQSYVGISKSSTGSTLVHGVFYPPDVEISDELSGVMLY